MFFYTSRRLGAFGAASGILLLFLLFTAGAAASRAEAEKTARLSKPRYPSETAPDNIVLLGAGVEERMRVNWRTSVEVGDGAVQYRRADESSAASKESPAILTPLKSEDLASDRTVHCFSAVMDDLEPGRSYEYRVGSPELDAWSGWREFRNGVQYGADFSFAYLGDTQGNSRAFGGVLEDIEKRHPKTAFYLIGGDLVNHGASRNNWDRFLHYTSPVFSLKPLLPALGNHDRIDGSTIFSRYFTVPGNGPDRSKDYVAYYFTAGNVFFVVLDSNESKANQTHWLERVLQMANREGFAFKIAMFHHPVYSPQGDRDYKSIEKHWEPLFDQYRVDLVLNGHAHSYLRTMKMHAGLPADAGTPGTVYVVANSSDKHYAATPFPYAAAQFPDVPTYQIINIDNHRPAAPVLRYAAYNRKGEEVDAFTLESAAPAPSGGNNLPREMPSQPVGPH